MQKYIYRKEFGLTAEQMADEPADEFLLNLRIMAYIEEKQRQELKHG